MVRDVRIDEKTSVCSGHILVIAFVFAMAFIFIAGFSSDDSSADYSENEMTTDVYYTGVVEDGKFTVTGAYRMARGPLLYEGDLVLSEYVKMVDGGRFIPVPSSEFSTKYPVVCFGNGTDPFVGDLTSIKLSPTVEVISDYSFRGLDIRDIEFPSSVTEIGDYAFADCKNLLEVSVPDTVLVVGTYSFSGCSNVNTVRIPSLRTTAVGIFKDCTELESVNIPSTVTEVSSYSFSGCTSLKHINFEGNTKNIGTYAFSGCSSLEDVSLPGSLQRIEMSAFSDCVSLKKVEVPASTTLIGSKAFYGCTSLEEIKLSDGLETINSEAFSGCVKITGIRFPETLRTIGSNVLYGSAITEVSIPDYVNRADQSAFSGCDYLETISIGKKAYVSISAFSDFRFKDTTGRIMSSLTSGYFYQKDGAYMNQVNTICKISWISQDDDGTQTVVACDYIQTGTVPSYGGETPMKTETTGYIYEFSGWTAEIVAAEADTTYYAKYTEIPKSFTVKWMSDGEVFQLDSVKYNDKISAPKEKPTKADTETTTYTFSKWNGYIDGIIVDGDNVFYAEFTEADKEIDNSADADKYLIPMILLGVLGLAVAIVGAYFLLRKE